MEQKRIKRVLISVWDKAGIAFLARQLLSLGVKIMATAGTAEFLAEKSAPVQKVSDYTGQSEMLGGKVKTLHPSIFAAVLASREERGEIINLGMEPIDMVIVNLSPLTFKGKLEGMDIGGHALLRAAIKNFENVAVVSSPWQYGDVIKDLTQNSCSISAESLQKLAREALTASARYDALVMEELFSQYDGFPPHIPLPLHKVMDLRYGENPHQRASLYELGQSLSSPFSAVLGGKGLSFNNIVDFQAAFDVVDEFILPAAAVVKHANPCGVALGNDPLEAFLRARETDPVSAFGGIIAANREVDERLAEAVTETFFEGIIAPGYAGASLNMLRKKKRLRILSWRKPPGGRSDREYRSVGSYVLAQDVDRCNESGWSIPTERKPTDEEMQGLRFAWKVARHVKSNAIVIGNKVETIGIGAGQMSRVDSCGLALKKARKKIKGSVLASDGFFPFRDSIDLAAKAGISTVIQPGGSIRDGDVIEACNEHGIAMVLTGRRHFRH